MGTFLHGRGHSTPSGTLCCRRVPSTRAGTGIPSPHARVVPGREVLHPAAQNAPVDVAGELAAGVCNARLDRDEWETGVDHAQVFRVGGHHGVPLLLRQQGDVNVNNVPVFAASAE